MIKIMNVIVGFLYVIGDTIKYLGIIVLSSVTLFFTENKKNNAFLRLISSNCLFVTFSVVVLVFYLVSMYSVILGLFISFLSFIWFLNERENIFKLYKRKEMYDDSMDYAGGFLALCVIVITLVTSNINSAYEYKQVGNYNFTKQDFGVSKVVFMSKQINKGVTERKAILVKTEKEHITMVMDGLEIEVYSKGCKQPGRYKIFEETLPIKYIPGTKYKFVYHNYYLECSDGYKHYKKIEKDIKNENA